MRDNQTEEAQEAEEPITSGELRVSDPRRATSEDVLSVVRRFEEVASETRTFFNWK